MKKKEASQYENKIKSLLYSFVSEIDDIHEIDIVKYEEIIDKELSKYKLDFFGLFDDLVYYAIIQYFTEVVIPHKIEVFKAGLFLIEKGLVESKIKNEFIENLIIHDISKFSANESYDYATTNFKSKIFSEGFAEAWNHHKHNNPHHSEYWLSVDRSGKVDALEMPNIYVLEMIADWIGAGKTYGTEIEVWIKSNLPSLMLHKKTRKDIVLMLNRINIT